MSASRVVVRSIGSASFALVDALKSVLPLSDAEVARCLFRAPSILLDDVSEAQAAAVASELSRAGLDVAVEPADAPFTPGDGRFDLVLDVRDYKRMGDLAAELVRLLGVDGRTARDMLCTVPCTLMGGVSEATARALTPRFSAFDVALCASDASASVFDAFVIAQGVLRPRVLDNLRASGFEIARDVGPDDPVVLTGLTRPVAEALWELVGRRADAVRVFDRAFERYDVVLEGGEATPALLDAVVRVSGMPPAVAPRALARAPIALARAVGFDEMRAAVEAVVAAGGRISAELTALQSLSVEVASCPDPRRAASVLRALLDLKPHAAEALLSSLPAVIEGPLTRPRAEWLQTELTALGAKSKVVAHRRSS